MCEEHEVGKEGRNEEGSDRQTKKIFFIEYANKIRIDTLLS